MKQIKIVFLCVVLALIVAGCTGYRISRQVDEMAGTEERAMEEGMAEEMTEMEMEQKAIEEQEMIEEMTKSIESKDWRDIELTDVEGNKFKISDFKGKPVLLESFAVWCPTCRKQQEKIKELHEEVGDAVISISIDTDPNEVERQVIDHKSRYGFDWIFTVSPIKATKSLIDEFGVGVVNAPSAPVVLVCEDLSARLMERGLKTVAELKTEIDRGC